VSDEVRPTPIANIDLLKSINAALNDIPERSVTAVLQVPQEERLRGGVYVRTGDSFSFAGWLEHDLKPNSKLGWGVAVRKTW
jgi:hypothetical protein